MGRPVLALLVLLACAGCASASVGAGRPSPSGGTTGQLPSSIAVAPPDGGVSVVWVPGMGVPHAREVRTHGSAAQAAALVRDIDAAPPFPSGTYACPAALGVDAHLSIATARGTEAVRIEFTGCPSVLMAGVPLKQPTAAVYRDLRPLAPPQWQRYLRP